MKRSLLAACAFATLLAACTDNAPATQAAPPPSAAIGTFGIDQSAMNASVKPGDDFFNYVNGTWVSSYAMPADKARYGVFDRLNDGAESDVRAIVDKLSSSPQTAGSNAQKVADLYKSWMDEATIEARGVEPLKPWLDKINAISSKLDLVKAFGTPGFAAPFGFGIAPDPDDTTRYTVFVGQDGLGMPNRDYYLLQGERFDAYRAAYKTYIATLFSLIGRTDPDADANAVIALETLIAEEHWSPEDQRDISKTFNPMDRVGLKKLAPTIDWDVVFAASNLADVNNMVVGETTAIADSVKLVDRVSLDTWKNYLTFHFISSNADYLPKAFDDADFAFYSKALRGIEAQRDRWKRGVSLVNGSLGEAVGQLYVERHFPAETKAKMDELVANLRTAFKGRLETLAWMDDETRAEALKKLSTFDPRVGYPEKWIDYSSMTIEPGKLFENVQAAREFGWNYDVNLLKGPVDRSLWNMTPQTVNAYYSPLTNQITFPAAILQPPFFDPNADPAVNYGAIGGVIGHEIGHGFDDQGREFDETGKIRNWWTEATNANFQEATSRLGAQYDSYCPLDEGKACINGQLSMGENIGDLGGLQMAYAAYQLSLNGQPAPVIDGFTGDQRFFMAWAQVWRAIQRDDALRNQMLTGPHSPAQFRTNGVVRNLDAWYAAFDVKEGDALYLPPEERVRIW
ncbi:M13 family peptidase [bacterium]|nr:M13 family peptidase [bacterium]